MTADHVKHDTVEAPVEVAEHAQACANCGAHLQGAFCHACGQRGHLHGRLWHLIEEFAEGIAHFDGRLWRTLPLLAFNPGRLSREWRQGRRIRYVAPLHVFLFATFLLFVIPNFTGRHLITLPDAMQVQEALDGEAPPTGSPTGMTVNVDAADGARAEQLGEGLLKRMQKVAENNEFYAYKIESLAYKLSFITVPISVVILAALLAFRRGYTLYDHAVVALYGIGFLTLLVAFYSLLPSAAQAQITGALFVVIGVHAALHLRGAYGLSWAGAILRTGVLGVLSGVGFLMFLLGVVALGVFS